MTQKQEEAIAIISKIITQHPDALPPTECATLLTAILEDKPRIEYIPWYMPYPIEQKPYTVTYTDSNNQ